jgi:hypothetical protein
MKVDAALPYTPGLVQTRCFVMWADNAKLL